MPSSGESCCFDEVFFKKRPTAAALVELFGYLPGVIFYAKNRNSEYIAANHAMLMAKEISDPAELLGKTDRDFHPSVVADAYIAEDRRVMESAQSLPHQVWFVIDRSGRPGWFQSSKVPLRDESGEVIGIAGTRYSIDTPAERDQQFRSLAPVIHFLEERYTENVSMKAMAKLADMSATHFNRQFVALFGMSPTQFVHSLRIEKSRRLLAETVHSIGEIALELGYHDQSHFTRHFRNRTGMTPRAYRQRFYTSVVPGC